MARERTGYPTQKPESLVERLVVSCSDAGDLVMDPYAGSGTTVAVSARLGRRAIGIDSSHVAIAVARERLRKDGVDFSEYRAAVEGAAQRLPASGNQAS